MLCAIAEIVFSNFNPKTSGVSIYIFCNNWIRHETYNSTCP
jgi:hypothetical protein